MSEKSSVYTSFPIHRVTDVEAINISKINNMIAEFDDFDVLDPLANGHDPSDRSESNINDIVKDDLVMMEKCDIMVGTYFRPSVGQSMEMFYVNHILKKPVIMIIHNQDVTGQLMFDRNQHKELTYFGKGMLSPWFLKHATCVLPMYHIDGPFHSTKLISSGIIYNKVKELCN